jgi:hypothetical protein
VRRYVQVLSCLALLLPPATGKADPPPCAFRFGLVVNQGMDLHGNNLYVDSFDSTDPGKSTNGLYDAAHRQPTGNVALGGSLTDSLTNLANANLYGYVFCGPTGTVTLGANGTIGPTFASPATNPAEAAANGWLRNDCSLNVADVTLPAEASSWSSLGSINNSMALTTGNYRATGILLGGPSSSLTIQGNVRLYVTGSVQVSGNGMIVIQPGGSLELYAAGNVSLGGKAVVNLSGLAASNRWHGLPTSTAWAMDGNGTWIGVMHAPSAALTLNGGGIAGDMSGVFVAESIVFNGITQLHCDESLAIQACAGISTATDPDGITVIDVQGQDVVVTFPLHVGKSYRVETSEELSSGTWTSLPPTHAATCTDEVIQVTDPGAAVAGQRFYRLRVEP